ncbi:MULTISPECIES: hypothetical protein [unclassified Streptomyces]|uniref:alpha/beta fold hydrolase n=1 Tax=unclassified Streptomyces TaxID=2593676 RepID=UPI002E809E21|nr:hypothetical protein [Streptomyces sp. NBC_00589]WTI35915.1 hypothetical protein OIC96_13355 [Streptomyces sp. NBC_00775]WUB30411.1 hypothetical protein OHA51_36375 [Streptomyces sp. NBC_00589]
MHVLLQALGLTGPFVALEQQLRCLGGHEEPEVEEAARRRVHDLFETVSRDGQGDQGQLVHLLGVQTGVGEGDQAADVVPDHAYRMPVLAVGGEHGVGSYLADSLTSVAPHVMGAVIADSGHYIPDERPEALLATLAPFLP